MPGFLSTASSPVTTAWHAVLFLSQHRSSSCAPNPKNNSLPFEPSSKRRRGFPSETQVRKGFRYVHGDKELLEKLGRNDPCPCGSGKCFQALLPRERRLSMAASVTTIIVDS
jgi:hypothetical protein